MIRDATVFETGFSCVGMKTVPGNVLKGIEYKMPERDCFLFVCVWEEFALLCFMSWLNHELKTVPKIATTL